MRVSLFEIISAMLLVAIALYIFLKSCDMFDIIHLFKMYYWKDLYLKMWIIILFLLVSVEHALQALSGKQESGGPQVLL